MAVGGEIVFIDDDRELAESLIRALGARLRGVTFVVEDDETRGVERVRELSAPVVILDLSLSPREGVESGFRALQRILEIDSATRVIVVTGHGDTRYGARAISLGAASFLEKPADVEHLAVLIEDGLRQFELRRAARRFEGLSRRGVAARIVGRSAAIEAVREQVMIAARNPLPVFINGETGTGKGVVAAAIHELSDRAPGAFVRAQPTFGSMDLVLSELFGHVRGAFTGAVGERTGLVAAAHRGTLFLDEVDELPAPAQVALLGTVQDRNFRRVGADRVENSDFRLISACNGDIDKAVREGKFRSDLLHRIAHVRIQLPPLRDRLEDIPDLVSHVLRRLGDYDGVGVNSASEEVLGRWMQHSWLGNVRELEAATQVAAYRAQANGRRTIEVSDLGGGAIISGAREDILARSLHESIEGYRRKLVEEALRRADGNQSEAARALGVERSQLRRLLRGYGLI